MTTLSLEPSRGGLLPLLRRELAPFAGRADTTLRFLLVCTIVIVASMTLQAPFLALSLISVFFTTQENTVLTKKSGISMILGAALAVVLSIVLIIFTVDYPLLRILGGFAIAFCGMYFLRISRLGPIGYIAALFTVFMQSLADTVDDPETLTRTMLWVGVAIIYPIVVTMVVNALVLPARPGELLAAELRRRLSDIEGQLDARISGHAAPALDGAAVEKAVLTLHRHLGFAALGDAGYRDEKGRHLMRIAAMDRLHTAAAHLARLPAALLGNAQRERLRQLKASCGELGHALAADTRFTSPPVVPDIRADEDDLLRIAREMAHALHAFAAADSFGPSAIPQQKDGLIAADAFDNPVYGQFAFRAVLGSLLCYVFFTAAQWPGIRTAMQTCIILALPSLGASTQRGVNRVLGTAIGSVLALLATVFVLPQLESIVGLLAMTLPVFAICAWITAGSARTSYIGVQMMYAFALALLGQFGPTTNLAEIRDRMMGILIGVAVSVPLSVALWPERDGDKLHATLARLLAALAGLARTGANPAAADKARLQAWSLLSQNRELQARVALEPGLRHVPGRVTEDLTTWLAQAQEVLLALTHFQLQVRHAAPHLSAHQAAVFDNFAESLAQSIDAAAESVGSGAPASAAAPSALPIALAAELGTAATEAPLSHLLAAAKALTESVGQITASHNATAI